MNYRKQTVYSTLDGAIDNISEYAASIHQDVYIVKRKYGAIEDKYEYSLMRENECFPYGVNTIKVFKYRTLELFDLTQRNKNW